MPRPALVLAVLALACGNAFAGDGIFARSEPRMAASADVTIVNELGDEHILADFLPSETAILHFWATWCVPCREELPELAAYADALAGQDLRDRLIVVAVEPSPRDKIDRFLMELGLDGFVTLQDRANRSGAVFGLFGMPSTLLLDAEGRVVGRRQGSLDWNDERVRAELQAHLGG